MGTGKSSVGRAVAQRTGLPRFDTDADDRGSASACRSPTFSISTARTEFRERETDALRAIACGRRHRRDGRRRRPARRKRRAAARLGHGRLADRGSGDALPTRRATGRLARCCERRSARRTLTELLRVAGAALSRGRRLRGRYLASDPRRSRGRDPDRIESLRQVPASRRSDPGCGDRIRYAHAIKATSSRARRSWASTPAASRAADAAAHAD